MFVWLAPAQLRAVNQERAHGVGLHLDEIYKCRAERFINPMLMWTLQYIKIFPFGTPTGSQKHWLYKNKYRMIPSILGFMESWRAYPGGPEGGGWSGVRGVYHNTKCGQEEEEGRTHRSLKPLAPSSWTAASQATNSHPLVCVISEALIYFKLCEGTVRSRAAVRV